MEKQVASVLSAQLTEEADDSDRRSVAVHLHDDGCVRLNAVETGQKVQNFWGTENYEYWVSVPAAELSRLVFHLLRERYAGSPDAVEQLRAFCERNGIAHQFEEWF